MGVQQIMCPAIATALYCPQIESVDQMLSRVMVDIILSIGYNTRVSFIQNILELLSNLKSALSLAISWRCLLEGQLHFHVLMFLE